MPQPDIFCMRPKRVLTPTVQREAWRKRPSPRHRFKRDAAYEALSARPNPAQLHKDGTIDGHQTNSAAPYLGPNRYEAAITSNGFGLPERAKNCGGTQGQTTKGDARLVTLDYGHHALHTTEFRKKAREKAAAPPEPARDAPACAQYPDPVRKTGTFARPTPETPSKALSAPITLRNRIRCRVEKGKYGEMNTTGNS